MLRASREKDAAQNLLGGWCPEDATRIADQLDAEVSDAIAQARPAKALVGVLPCYRLERQSGRFKTTQGFQREP